MQVITAATSITGRRLLPHQCRWASSMANALGQPSHVTHPHTMALGHSQKEFRDRRERLGRDLPASSLAIIPAYKTRYSSLNIFYPFQQNNNLTFLTGFDEPNAVLVLHKNESGGLKSIIFVEENDEHTLLWSGPRCGLKNAQTHFGLDQARQFKELDEILVKAKGFKTYLDFDENTCLSGKQVNFLESCGALPIKELLHRQRLIKSMAEQQVMREASRIGGEAFRETMHWSKGRTKESDLAAKMEFEARIRGASGLSYVPVVAGGDRANIIHYVRNDRLIGEGEMVLMDAGAKVYNYCNDITRTWPISGRFSSAQKELYEVVLRVQKRCIQAASRWGQFPNISLNTLNHIAMVLFVDELGALGFSNPEKAVNQLFPHSIGHYLGLDLHDCHSISYDEQLKEGMIITIEPGLYVPANDEYPIRFHGMGVRIEDDILLTIDGCENLTGLVPREVEEIEQVLNK